MRGIRRALIRLYPASWRARYGEEFEALLEDSPATFQSTFDLLKGALKMHVSVPAFPKLAVILSIAGMAGGLGISYIVPARYIAQAEMQIVLSQMNEGKDVRRALTERIVKMEQQTLSRTSLSNIIHDPRLDLYSDERAYMPLEDVIERMRTRDIRIQLHSLPGEHRHAAAFSVSFVYRDRMKAQQTVQALITSFQDANLTTQRDLAALNRAGENLDVLSPPGLPTQPATPNRAAFMATGFGAGFLLAAVIAIFRRKAPPIPYPAQTV